MRDTTRKTLELFNEKVAILEERNFVRFLNENGGISYNLHFSVGQPLETSIKAPDEESLAALITTFRMFIQNNDRISLENLSKLFDDPGLSENWKAQIADVRNLINATLDRTPSMAIEIDGVRSTAREIMDTFIYGDLAHTNKDKRETFLSWKSNPLIFQFLQHSFHSIVLSILDAVRYISECNRLELAGEPVPRLPTAEERAAQLAARSEE